MILFFVLNVPESLKSQLFSDHETESESEEETGMMLSEMDGIREFVKLSRGSKSEDC
jgi:hypothetical protein